MRLYCADRLRLRLVAHVEARAQCCSTVNNILHFVLHATLQFAGSNNTFWNIWASNIPIKPNYVALLAGEFGTLLPTRCCHHLQRCCIVALFRHLQHLHIYC